MILGLGNALSSIALRTGASSVSSVSLATDNWSVYFDGTDDYITTPFDLGTEVGTGDVSISTWVKFADLSADQFFLYFGTSDIATAYVTLKYDLSDNEIQSVTRRVAGGSILARYDMTGKTTSDWLHIVYTRTGTTTNLYANGTLADSQSGIQGDSAFGDTTFFGALSGAITGNCRLSQVSVWSSLLSATEITALYNSGTPVDPTVNGGDYASSANLVGSWDMENTGTTTVTDNSSNSNDGNLTNGAAFDADVPVIAIPTWADNRSVLFDGTNDLISVSDSDDLTFGDGVSDSPFSVSAWVKYTGSGTQGVVVKGASGTEEWAFFFASNKLVLQLYTDISNRNNVQSVSTITTGSWIHVAATYDGSNPDATGITLYLNGSAISGSLASAGTYTTMNNKAGSAYIGQLLGSNYLNGNVSEICVWSSELTAANVTSLYNSGTPIDSSTIDSANVAGHWPLEAGSGITALDYSGNGNHGTLINGPTWSSDTP